MTLKPWREIAVPHADVLQGVFQQAEFAADISRVHEGTATPEYQDPVLFFQRTFITEGMRLLLNSVVKRLCGRGGDPVIQLQTAFGGGKTHTMLAVYHLAKGTAAASELAGVRPILDAANVLELPRANIAVLDGIKASPNQPQERGGIKIHTLWGDLAWQLGGAEGYAMVADADTSGTSPGKAVLEALLKARAPCVILVDELVAYVRQFEGGKVLTGGTYNSNLSFVQALTEALKAVPNAVMLASLPQSEKEAGSSSGVKALEALAHCFGRVQALWKPVATEEAFEIVRRRLFASIDNQAVAASVCRAFADFYVSGGTDFPNETQESRYYERLLHAYPIHPEVFDRLYGDWSSLDSFQRTRGVLKLMAKMIFRLWQDNNNDPLIMPGSLPLYDADCRNDMIYYLPPGWDPVLERDVDGDRAETSEIEKADPRLGAVQACRRAARAIFLGSAPTTAGQMVRGLESQRILLGVAQPGQQLGLYKDALRRLVDRLQYLNSGHNRFWFDTRPNLRREMEERKRRFQDKEDLLPALRQLLQRGFASNIFGGQHVFLQSGDIPDDWQLRLVVLPPDATYSRNAHGPACEMAADILKNRGDQPRFKQNRLIFLAPEQDSVSRLKDQVRSYLAWQSIVEDIRSMKLNLDQFQSLQATQSLEAASDALRRMIRECYKWLLAPVQTAQAGKGLSPLQWEGFAISASAPNVQQEIERVLKENEVLITEWAPIHLAKELKNWFWKDEQKEVGALKVWQMSCQHLYLPRLKDEAVFQRTLAAGSESREFFALAQGRDGDQYHGLVFGQRTSPILDDSLLLIEPAHALADLDAVRAAVDAATSAAAAEAVRQASASQAGDGEQTGNIDPVGPDVSGNNPPRAEMVRSPYTATRQDVPVNKHFFGSVAMDPALAKQQFADVFAEVIAQFATRPGVNLTITLDIQAESVTAFDEGLQRAVKENCKVLRFKSAGFEE